MNKAITSLSAVALLAAAASGSELLINGDFETGDFTGWSANNLSGGNGDIFASNLSAGSLLSLSGTPAAGPSGGSWYAAVDQLGPGAYSLEQTFTLPANAIAVQVSFDIYSGDQSFAAPLSSGEFDFVNVDVQWQRVDILDASGGIVVNLFDAFPNASYQTISQDVTALLTPGDSYTFRFAQADNQFFFHGALDNASVQFQIPSPGAASLLAVVGLAAARRRR